MTVTCDSLSECTHVPPCTTSGLLEAWRGSSWWEEGWGCEGRYRGLSLKVKYKLRRPSIWGVDVRGIVFLFLSLSCSFLPFPFISVPLPIFSIGGTCPMPLYLRHFVHLWHLSSLSRYYYSFQIQSTAGLKKIKEWYNIVSCMFANIDRVHWLIGMSHRICLH